MLINVFLASHTDNLRGLSRVPAPQLFTGEDSRAQNNGRSTDNVRPDRGLDQSNSSLAGRFWIGTFLI